MICSPNAHILIKHFEGLRLKAYRCPSGVFTIAYGHVQGVKEGDVCTKEQADKMLQDDLHIFEAQVLKALNADEIAINQHQFDALICFAFNLGTYTLVHGSRMSPVTHTGKLWQALKDKDYQRAKANFLLYTNRGLRGLVIRRTAESMLFDGQDIDSIMAWVKTEQATK
jgi:lysozyme